VHEWFDRRLDIAMINSGAVQRNKRHAAVLDVMNQNIADPELHARHRNDQCRRPWPQASKSR